MRNAAVTFFGIIAIIMVLAILEMLGGVYVRRGVAVEEVKDILFWTQTSATVMIGLIMIVAWRFD